MSLTKTKFVSNKRHFGLSYVEVLIAIVLISLALIPAIEALNPGVQAASVVRDDSFLQVHLEAKMQAVLSEPFNVLEAEALELADPAAFSSFSDNAGEPNRRLVMLSSFDGDDADGDGDVLTGGDQGLLWLRVEIAGTERFLETLISAHGR